MSSSRAMRPGSAARIASALALSLGAAIAGCSDDDGLGLPEPVDPSAILARLVEERIGRPVEMVGVAFEAGSPPRLTFEGVSIAGDPVEGPDAFEAAGARLPVDLPALLGGRLVVDALEADSAILRLRPDLELRFGDVRITAVAADSDAPVDFQATGRLETGGHLRALGRASKAEGLDMRVTLDEVDLAPAAEALPRVSRLKGVADGEIHLVGPLRQPTTLTSDLRLRDARIRLQEIRLRESLSVEAELGGLFDGADPGPGHVRIEATDAFLDYQGMYQKEPGTSARVEGTLGRAEDGDIELLEAKLQIGK